MATPPLGPHVVGRRVVVRRRLPGLTGPTGGPALTDVLGVCESWADGQMVVRRDDGTRLAVPLSEVVAGKPVPPRPSTAHRVTPREAQLRALALWPDLETEPLAGWTLRRSPRHAARRANSVLAFGPTQAADPVDRVVAFYVERGRRPVAAVLPGSAEERLFTARGWVPESGDADTLFQVAPVVRARRAVARAGPTVPVDVAEERGLAVARVGGDASGVAAYADGWVGFRSMSVSPGRRRRGLALAVMGALLAWGADRGAATAYLQVLGDNDAAVGLYARLGFRTHHAYRYLAG